MDKRAIRTPEGARAIIEFNIQKIYHLPSKYWYLNKALTKTRKELLQILNYIKDIPPLIGERNEYVWFLPTKFITERARKGGANSTNNKHFNYLCCLGVLVKVPQYDGHRIGINEEFRLETGRSRDMNVFTVHRYTDTELEKIEARAKILCDHKVTSGNLSKDKLLAAGLPDLAKIIVKEKETYTAKKEDFQSLLKALESIINDKGYATMQDLAKSLHKSQDQIRELNKLFKLQLEEQYYYKAATKQQREQLNITTKKWIFTKVEKEQQ